MPWNDPKIQKYILNYIAKKHPPTTVKILDVGPGTGTFGNYLKQHFYIEAIEIFELYYYKYELEKKYNHVIDGDVRTFENFEKYDLCIVGDVFEHMTYEESRIVIDRMKCHVKEIIMSLPYNSVQGPECGNAHEEHIQDDLTPESVAKKYPEFKKVYEDMTIGHNGLAVFIWEKD